MSHHDTTQPPSSTPTGRKAHLDDPNVRFVEVDVDTTRLRAEPPAGRRRLELDEPALRRHPPRHRVARGLRELLSRVGHRPGHDDRAVRRQQQLVRRLGVLAAQAVRPSTTSASSTAGASTGSTTACRCPPTCPPTTRPATSCPRRTSRCGPSATTSCRGSATRSSPSWTSARRPSSTARSSRRRA